MYWKKQRHNWQLQENQTGISNVRIKSSAQNDHHPPSHKLKNYSMWSILQEKVYRTHISDLVDLKHCIRTEWAKLDHTVIAATSVALTSVDIPVWFSCILVWCITSAKARKIIGQSKKHSWQSFVTKINSNTVKLIIQAGGLSHLF